MLRTFCSVLAMLTALFAVGCNDGDKKESDGKCGSKCSEKKASEAKCGEKKGSETKCGEKKADHPEHPKTSEHPEHPK